MAKKTVADYKTPPGPNSKKFVITISEIFTYNTCKRKYYYNYVRLLQRKYQRALYEGTIFHKCMELYHNGRQAEIEKYIDDTVTLAALTVEMNPTTGEATTGDGQNAYMQETDEIKFLLKAMMRTYGEWNETPIGQAKALEIAETESVFYIPLIDPDTGKVSGKYVQAGKRDGITLDKTVYATETQRAEWLLEHKSTQAILTNLEFDLQTTSYLYAMWRESEKTLVPMGCVYNQVMKKVPTVPELLKKGGLSTAANKSVTPARYREAIAANHLNEADYTEYLTWLESAESWERFVRREWVLRNVRDLLEFEHYIWTVAKEITKRIAATKRAEAKAQPDAWARLWYKAPNTMNCGRCGFKGLCLSEDHEFTLANEYEVRKDKHQELTAAGDGDAAVAEAAPAGFGDL